jgi:hypothetical protein
MRPPRAESRHDSGLARELEADVPQIVTSVHVGGIGEGEVLCSTAHTDFFHDNVRAIGRTRDEQPAVIRAQLITVAVPAETVVRGELGDLADDLETERCPLEGDILVELAGRVIDDDVASVRIPRGPRFSLDELRPGALRWGVDDNDIVCGLK